jgi:hypothetical protein
MCTFLTPESLKDRMDLISSDESMLPIKRYFLIDESILSIIVKGNFPDSHVGVMNR